MYQHSLKLLKHIYEVTKSFPKEEQFLLTNQLRRASISVCSNFAEGAARKSSLGKKRFYEVSRSSVVEIDTQIEIALLLEYLQKEKITDMEKNMESVFRMLSKMIENLERPTGH